MAPARKPFYCGNWKLFGTVTESVALATGVAQGLSGHDRADVALAPGFIALGAVGRALAENASRVALAAQDCHFENKGAFTGEVGPTQLRDVGCAHVILGHSERRALFGETDAAVGRKVRAALDAGLGPIVCVGETLAERDQGVTLERVGAQLDAALAGLDDAAAGRLVMAYEPVWAIGTGRNATPAQAGEVHGFIRRRLRELWGPPADTVRILYGGSVKPDNIRALSQTQDVDGALVGGASLDAASFLRIIEEGTASWSRS